MRAINLALISFWFIANLANASPDNPVEGLDYRAIATPQAVVATGKKVEVIEFFMYHCPACNSFEPQLLAWVDKQGDNIVFRRMHLPHHGKDDAEAHLFLTLDAMKLEDKLHAKILQTWHVEHHQLITDQDNIDWAVKNGIDKTQFLEAYTSFSVMSKLHDLLRLAASYQVNSTPTLVIDGRYLDGPGIIQDSNQGLGVEALNKLVLQIADGLVDKARSTK
jgi:thiol:disulfide interchange protein DsbA